MVEEKSDAIEIRAHDVDNNWWNKHDRLQGIPVNESDYVYIERYNWWQLGRYMCTLNDIAPNGWEKVQLHELTQSMRQKDMKSVNCLNKIHTTVNTPLRYWRFKKENRRYQRWWIFLKNADIISLNETHLGHSDTLTSDMMGISKDVLIACFEHNNRKGGVALILNKKLNLKQIRINTILEIVAVKISEPIQMIVVLVYWPPSTPTDVFMNHMLEIIAQFQHVPTCILGDFNEDVSITSNTCCCGMFWLQAFKQMISILTHESGTITDLVYVFQTLNTMQTDVTDC